MMRRRISLIAVASGLFFAISSFNASAAGNVVLSDSSLLDFADVGGSGGGDLDLITDIPGDPGVQYDITWVDRPGYTDIAIGKYSPTEIGIGDRWQLSLRNLDPSYQTFARLYMQVDGWVYYQGDAVWLSAGGGEATISILNPATSVVNAMGIKIGTDDWTGRPTGSSVSVQVIPEPSSAALVGIGSMLVLTLRRNRS